jgi:hypothetical protein
LIDVPILHFGIYAFHDRISFLHLRCGIVVALLSQIYSECSRLGINIALLFYAFFAILMGIPFVRIMAAPGVIAPIGTIVAVSVVVVVVAALFALLDAIAVLTASIAVPVRMLDAVLNTAAWTVLVDIASIFTLVAVAIAACLPTLLTFFEDIVISVWHLQGAYRKCPSHCHDPSRTCRRLRARTYLSARIAVLITVFAALAFIHLS